MNRQQRGRYEARRRRMRRRRIISVSILTVVAAAVIAAVVSFFSTDVYQDEKEFRDYADNELKKNEEFAGEGDLDIRYEYGSPVSEVIESGPCSSKDVKRFRDARIKEIKAEYRKKAGSDADKADEEDRVYALIIRSSVYEAENGALSLSIYSSENSAADKSMHMDGSKMETYQFSAETGRRLKPFQIFSRDYAEICSDHFLDHFSREYDEDELVKGWESRLKADEKNFSSFSLTEDGVIFYFEEGSVLDKEQGVTAAGIYDKDIRDCMLKKIKERYIDPEKPMVALTYDDGPGGAAEARILKCLKENGSVATFFYMGSRVASDSDNVKTAYDMQCEIGAHTWSHPVLTSLSTKKVRKELKDTDAAIRKVTGEDPTVFRPSYGETNEKINRMSGLPVIMWTIDTLDWESRNAKKIIRTVTRHKDLDGKIILMHSIYDTTADASEKLIPWLNEEGYQLVTVSELIRYKTGSEPVAGKVYREF